MHVDVSSFKKICFQAVKPAFFSMTCQQRRGKQLYKSLLPPFTSHPSPHLTHRVLSPTDQCSGLPPHPCDSHRHHHWTLSLCNKGCQGPCYLMH